MAVIDRNFCFGVGGIFAQEIRAALCGLAKTPVIFNYIAGLGGRDIPPGLIEQIYATTKTSATRRIKLLMREELSAWHILSFEPLTMLIIGLPPSPNGHGVTLPEQRSHPPQWQSR